MRLSLIHICMAFVAYNIGSWLFYGAAFGIGQVLAIVVSLAALWMIVRPAPKKKEVSLSRTRAIAATCALAKSTT